MKKYLPDVTLICVDCIQYGNAIQAMQKSLQQITPARAVFLTDVQFDISGIETVIIPRINSKKEYSEFMIKDIYRYFDTSHVLVIQADGWVLDGEAWNDEFLMWDYIGAPWLYVDGRNIGNGGFSLRSKDLCERLAMDTTIEALHPEDDSIARLYRPYLEAKYNIEFAPEELADTFAFELREPKCSTFGFHGFFHDPHKETIVLHRSGALGDVITMEPVMRVLHNKGYRVVLDVPAHLFDVFVPHDFPVRHISQFDSGRIPAKYIDLDMAYEVKPKQLHLKSYFEVCGISGIEPTNPHLFVGENMKKLFKNYAVIHIDERDTMPRNVRGVNWEYVVKYLEGMGYAVLQIGNGIHQTVATEINTPTIGFLKWIIGGANLFIGVDSGPAQIAVACGIPAAIFFGNVDPTYIYANLDNICTIEVYEPCGTQKCWHNTVTTNGQICTVNAENPPCIKFDTKEVIDAINTIHLA